MAARFLERRGVRVVEQNRRVGRHEADLIVEHAGLRVLVEVKTRRLAGHDPTERIDAHKMESLFEVATAVGCSRIDAVGVSIGVDRCAVRWRLDIG